MTTPITGKRIAITGTLSVPRKFIFQQIRLGGGIPTNSISKNTDFLVVGDLTSNKRIPDGMSRKLRIAVSLRDAGERIQIIDEDVLDEMLRPVYLRKEAS